MALPRPVPAAKLRRICDPSRLGFTTTHDLKPLTSCLGQTRAEEAFDYGLSVKRNGYNLFAMSGAELSTTEMVDQLVGRTARRSKRVPSDWVYVHNFDDVRRPEAMALPAGRGRSLRDGMARFLGDLSNAIPAAFESDEYRARLGQLKRDLEASEEAPIIDMRRRAEADGLLLLKTPSGLSLAPAVGKGKEREVIDEQEYNALSEVERKEIEVKISHYQKEIQEMARILPKLRRELRRRIQKLNQEVTSNAVALFVADLLKEFQDLPEVTQFLGRVARDILENSERFAPKEETPVPFLPGIMVQAAEDEGDPLLSYRVNLFVDHSKTQSAPVVHEANPNYPNLFGRIEHANYEGTLVTDFTFLRAGAIHRANGGYLVLQARDLLFQPFVWESLKRVLRSSHATLESPGQAFGLVSTITLEPEPIPLNLKVVLVGDRYLYYLLRAHDPDFARIFRVAADFEEDVPFTLANQRLHARMLATEIQEQDLMPFDKSAIARILEECLRWAGDNTRLGLQSTPLSNLLMESDHVAGKAGRSKVRVGDVAKALERIAHRNGRLREKIHDGIHDRVVLVDCKGERVGQINALSVFQVGDISFGQPTRLTVTARSGHAGILDIEREAKLGGPLHTKGVMILSGFLKNQFLPRQPLSLSASIVFEQSYGGVDGDSASSAELYGLISAISEIPIRQDLAVTGSVNQHGDIQAIGGVNEKIEGFYDICRERGLTGTQGVLIPHANLRHLMLRPDVVAACQRGEFQVYPIKRVEEGIELLMGKRAGRRLRSGQFQKDTVFAAVEDQLQLFSEIVKGDQPEKTKCSPKPKTSPAKS